MIYVLELGNTRFHGDCSRDLVIPFRLIQVIFNLTSSIAHLLKLEVTSPG